MIKFIIIVSFFFKSKAPLITPVFSCLFKKNASFIKTVKYKVTFSVKFSWSINIYNSKEITFLCELLVDIFVQSCRKLKKKIYH